MSDLSSMVHSVSSPTELPILPAAHGLEAQEPLAKAGGTGAALELHWLSLGSRKAQGLCPTSNRSCGASTVAELCGSLGFESTHLVQWAALFQMLNSP